MAKFLRERLIIHFIFLYVSSLSASTNEFLLKRPIIYTTSLGEDFIFEVPFEGVMGLAVSSIYGLGKRWMKPSSFYERHSLGNSPLTKGSKLQLFKPLPVVIVPKFTEYPWKLMSVSLKLSLPF